MDAYGVARYREVNPATWTIITFPFLFAVMFGDVGHAVIMTAFAILLLVREKKMLREPLSDMVGMIFGGRYIILLMGLFSLFTGAMYNEFFSMPITIAGPTKYMCLQPGASDAQPWRDCAGLASNATNVFTSGLVLPEGRDPYQFGLDPIWHGTRSELSFLNSLKMKMSILMGVVHMTLGIFMSLFNHVYFRDRLSLVYEFIPQMIFLYSLFGYLCFLIVFKWVAWEYLEVRSTRMSSEGVGRPPDIFHIMIYMFLSPTDIDCGGEGAEGACTENNIFPGQTMLQVVLVLAALCAVPVMLLPKPLILKKRHEERMVRFKLLAHASSALLVCCCCRCCLFAVAAACFMPPACLLPLLLVCCRYRLFAAAGGPICLVYCCNRCSVLLFGCRY